MIKKIKISDEEYMKMIEEKTSEQLRKLSLGEKIK